jgi:O-antigen/teichoic acid export membrane protein
MNIKSALGVTFAERYSSVIVNMIMVAVVARLLTPAQIGVAAIGASVICVVECLRDFGTTNFIVQAPKLSPAHARSSFTVLAITSVVGCVVTVVCANILAAIYVEPDLASFLRIAALAFLAGPVGSPLMALMRREMDFRSLAIVNSISTISNATVIIALAAAGFGPLSFAWGTVALYVTNAAVAIVMRRDVWIFKPQMRYWKDVLPFGAYSSLSDILGRLQDMATYLVLGRSFQAEAVGFYSRAVMICFLPIKIVAAGVVPVAFPALAVHARQGFDLKGVYLRATSYITAIQWPGLLLLASLAHTVVAVYLGRQWLSIVPLVQVLAIAGIITSTVSMNSPILMALGAVQRMASVSLANVCISITSIWVAAKFGLVAAAFSQLLISPILTLIAFCALGKYVKVKWRELIGAVRGSAVVAIFTVIGPTLINLSSGSDHVLGAWTICLAVTLACFGWVSGVWFVQHPILAEIKAFPLLALSGEKNAHLDS